MSTCICGNPIDTIGTTCSRCGALQTLGLDMNASAAEIEGAYLTMVKAWHPDRFQTDPQMKRAAEEKLKEINAAHDYLTAAISQPTAAGTADPTPARSDDRVHYRAATFDSTKWAEEIEARGEEEEPEEVRQVLKRLKKRSRPKLIGKVMVWAGGIFAVGLLGFTLDFILSSNEKTARSWEQFKTEVTHDLRSKGLSPSESSETQETKPDAAQPTGDANGQVTAPTPIASTKSDSPSGGHAKNAAAVSGAKPYVTSGLTPMEVLAILGSPTSSSGEKMYYKGSEIDFKNGHVAGWKIDEKTPIRVKLWPDKAPVPGMTTFAVGSSKSDVIAIQGTPSLFSDNEFGYGKSIVLFQNDRVTGWKEDPSSVRLRVVAH